MINYLTSNRLLSTKQHGFLTRRSTLTQLMLSTNDWYKAVDDGSSVDVIFLDLAKAFDSVSHKKLIKKLEFYGIGGKLYLWLQAFLTNRYQRVRVGDEFSQWSPVTSGVPQGSVLGPLLFLLYVNDMCDVVQHSSIYMYADDTKLYMSYQQIEYCQIFQNDLNSIYNWTKTWQLKINVSKCSVMHIGRRNPKSHYYIGNEILNVSVTERDLGIFVSNNLMFSEHCSKIASKASQRIGLLLHAFVPRDLDFLIRMFKIYIRPILEYNSCVWSPRWLKDVDLIESVQRSFTRRIIVFWQSIYGGGLSYRGSTPC